MQNKLHKFQWAPTLGGECYVSKPLPALPAPERPFQWAPTLGGECYELAHRVKAQLQSDPFQWAPTLGGECYINPADLKDLLSTPDVSMGTHPWG